MYSAKDQQLTFRTLSRCLSGGELAKEAVERLQAVDRHQQASGPSPLAISTHPHTLTCTHM